MKLSGSLLLVFGLATAVLAGQEMNGRDYEALAAGPWKTVMLGDRPFTFYRYGSIKGRLAQEFESQKLLTPGSLVTNYYPQMNGIFEWGWTLRPDGGNKRQCYEWTKRWYLKQKSEMQKPGCGWVTFTGHEWFSCYGAEWGANLISLEVAENIIATQAQTAMARGAARLHGLPVSMQASQWYSSGGVPAFRSDWTEQTPVPMGVKAPTNIWAWSSYYYHGGHSSSMLSRLWHFAWLSGASYMVPEACQDNFFARDMAQSNAYYIGNNLWVPKDPDQRALLSPIGKRGQKFVELTGQHPDVGIPYTPFLLMLDHFAGFNGFHYVAPRPWQVLEAGQGDRDIWAFLDTIYPRSMERDLVAGVNDDWYNPQTEDKRLVNSPWGDSFDILLSPRPHGALGQEKMVKEDPMYPKLERYQTLLNTYPAVILVGDHEFPFETLKVLAAYLKQGGEVWLSRRQADALGPKFPVLKSVGKLDVYDMDKIPDLMDRLTAQHVPLEVKGDVEYLVNRTRAGWVVGLINNAGITKAPRQPVVVDPAKRDAIVTLRLKQGSIASVRDWGEDRKVKVKEGRFEVSVAPGEVSIFEIEERK